VSGGSLTIGRARVEATAFWEPEFGENRTYIVFPTSRNWPATDVIAYEITAEGRLENISRDLDPDAVMDNLHGLPLADAKQFILAAPPRGRQPRLVAR